MARNLKHGCDDDRGEPPNKKPKRDAPDTPEGQGQKSTTPKKDEKKRMMIFQKRRMTTDFKQLQMLRLHVVPNRQQRDGNFSS